MKKLNNKGFTVVELTVSFLFVFIIAFAMYQLLYNYKMRQNEESIEAQMMDYHNQITIAIQNDISDKNLRKIDYCMEAGTVKNRCLVLYFNDGSSKQLAVEEREKEYDGYTEEDGTAPTVNYINYGGTIYESPDAVLLDFKSGYMLYSSYDNDANPIEDENVTVYRISIPIYHNDLDENYGISIVAVGHDYNYTETAGDPIVGGGIDDSTIPTTNEGREYSGALTSENFKIEGESTAQTLIARVKFNSTYLANHQQFFGNWQLGGSGLTLSNQKLCYSAYVNNKAVSFGNTYKTVCTSTISADTFYIVTGVFDRANNSMKIYLNGSPIATSTITANEVISGSSMSFAIGGNQGVSVDSNFFYGVISDAVIYNVAIDESVIGTCLTSTYDDHTIDRNCLTTNGVSDSNKKLDRKFSSKKLNE